MRSEAASRQQPGLTIDEVARRAGITTRNVRAYQERGLLPAPTKVGRTGYYEEGHVARLRGISTLLERGYSLAAIRELLDSWERGEDIPQLLGLEAALGRPWTKERPVRLSAAELAERFPADPALLEEAVRLGLVTPEAAGDGFTITSPAMLDAGAQLVGAGVPPEAVLAQAAALAENAERMAQQFVAMFVDHVWAPFVASGKGPDDLARVADLIDRLRPLAQEAVVLAFDRAMQRQISDALGRGAAALRTGSDTTVPRPTTEEPSP